MAPCWAFWAWSLPGVKKKEFRKTKTFDGLALQCYDSWHAERQALWVHNEIFQFGAYKFGEEHLKEGDVVFDVGANLGLFSIHLAMTGPKNLTVHAFEPVPQLARYCTANVAEYCPKSYTVHNVGVGSKDGIEEELTYFPDYPALSSIDNTDIKDIADQDTLCKFLGTIKGNRRIRFEYHFMRLLPKTIMKQQIMRDGRAAMESKQKCAVKIRTVSSLIRETGVAKVDFLKVDVEGHELEVLKGIEDEHWPIIKRVQLDVDAHHEEVIGLLERHGFEAMADEAQGDFYASNRNVRAWRRDEPRQGGEATQQQQQQPQ